MWQSDGRVLEVSQKLRLRPPMSRLDINSLQTIAGKGWKMVKALVNFHLLTSMPSSSNNRMFFRQEYLLLRRVTRHWALSDNLAKSVTLLSLAIALLNVRQVPFDVFINNDKGLGTDQNLFNREPSQNSFTFFKFWLFIYDLFPSYSELILIDCDIIVPPAWYYLYWP